MEPKYTRATILEIINNELETMSPDQASNWAVRLAVMNDTTGDELAAAEAAHHRDKEKALFESGVAAKADVEARGKPNYENMLKLKYQYESTLEIVNTLKKKVDLFGKQMGGTPR